MLEMETKGPLQGPPHQEVCQPLLTVLLPPTSLPHPPPPHTHPQGLCPSTVSIGVGEELRLPVQNSTQGQDPFGIPTDSRAPPLLVYLHAWVAPSLLKYHQTTSSNCWRGLGLRLNLPAQPFYFPPKGLFSFSLSSTWWPFSGLKTVCPHISLFSTQTTASACSPRTLYLLTCNLKSSSRPVLPAVL